VPFSTTCNLADYIFQLVGALLELDDPDVRLDATEEIPPDTIPVALLDKAWVADAIVPGVTFATADVTVLVAVVAAVVVTLPVAPPRLKPPFLGAVPVKLVIVPLPIDPTEPVTAPLTALLA